MKNKWRNISIKKKIFILSTITIIISFTLLYMCMRLFMPRVYATYKMRELEDNIEVLEDELENNININLNYVLDRFSYDNNVELIIVSKNDHNYITGILYSSFRDGEKNPSKIPFIHNYNTENKLFYYNKIYSDNYIKPDEFIYEMVRMDKSLNFDRDVYIRCLNKKYNMIVHMAISPKNESATSIELFFPFAVIAIIIIALTISFFYSILISKPLIKINSVARKMADLDFDNIIEISGNDEIGELSNSLNLMNTNLKDSFKKLEKINARLTKEIEIERKLEKERREFIATISHELKSPITIISGQLEGMIYNIGKYKDRDKYLKESYEVTQKMRELVHEILSLSERENGEFKYKFDKINVSNVIMEIINELEYFIDEKKLILEYTIEENVIILADLKLIKKAVTNIIKNAIIYSPSQEKIIINLTKKQLSVENTGITIPDTEINEIFNAFYRVDKSRNRKTGGSGLGLYIVKTILDNHKNINYSIESKVNSVIFKIIFL